MRTRSNYHTLINYFIASVWFVNGFFCKILNLIPRHEMIVAEILSSSYSRSLIVLIGISEIIMAIWIISRFRSRINALTQIITIATMNILEFILVPELLLWGRWNAVFALMLIVLIYSNEFVWHQKFKRQSPA